VHWIIGTAGHIDHGKTSLIKALTGQDTDRLKEEKERGISIELGFAYLDLPDGVRAGVVDVPGHERFIRHMLAGAHGIDLVLFTVAADDGVMPQTVEHLDILHLLGVTRAIFVITKADLASKGRIEDAADEIRVLTADSSLNGSPIVPFSFVTGEGLQQLREQIADRLRGGNRPRSDGHFRLPVDRAFVSPGHGVIVTGTAVGGVVRSGDAVRCLPGNEMLRVRSIEVHNEPVETAAWGQRIALNLTGSSRASIARGDVICHEAITLTCDRFDARVEVRPAAPAGIKDHQRVRVHLGTAERLGKVIPLGSREKPGADHVAPGDTTYCQITLSAPVAAMKGDRFILRDETAQRTLGGGIVLRPAAAKHKRGDSGLLKRLEAFERGADAALVDALTAESGTLVIAAAALAQLLNRTEEDVRARFDALEGVHVFHIEGGPQYASERACRRLKASLVDALRAWHVAHPLQAGIDIEEARSSLAHPPPTRIFRMIVQELGDEQAVVREGSLLRLPGHRVAVPNADLSLVERITTLLGQTPLSPPDIKQMADDLGVDRRRLAELMRAMERQRSIVCVAPDLYFLRDCVDRVRGELVRDLSAKDTITTAEFRDRYKTSRKYAIPLLEYFDRAGVTARVGDVRRLKHPRTEGA
jgi:selenocysteine-specific elongation factor